MLAVAVKHKIINQQLTLISLQCMVVNMHLGCCVPEQCFVRGPCGCDVPGVGVSRLIVTFDPALPIAWQKPPSVELVDAGGTALCWRRGPECMVVALGCPRRL